MRISNPMKLIATVLAALTLSACSSSPQMLHYWNLSDCYISCRVAVKPVELDIIEQPLPIGTFGKTSVHVSAEDIHKEFRIELHRSKIFNKVLFGTKEDCANAALSVKLRIIKAPLKFVKFDGWGMTLFYWFLAWVPSWYHADEVYEIKLIGEMIVASSATGKTVFRKPISITYQQHLDDFQRGWQLYGLFRVPESLDMDNWKWVEFEMMPYAVNRFVYKAVKCLGTDFHSKCKSKSFRRKLGIE